MLTEEMRYKLMRVLEANPTMSQRDIARELDVSLGKVNYCLQALIGKGLVKAKSFTSSNNKTAYMYLLTARGIEQKANISVRFLRNKMLEYEALRIEIDRMKGELEEQRLR